jgi:hypothetical protein
MVYNLSHAHNVHTWDDVQFMFWKHKVTNFVLSAVRMALKEDDKTNVNKLLFAAGDHNNVTVKAGDKRNLAGLLICHPLLLASPYEEPANLDAMLDELLLERHPVQMLDVSFFKSLKSHYKKVGKKWLDEECLDAKPYISKGIFLSLIHRAWVAACQRDVFTQGWARMGLKAYVVAQSRGDYGEYEVDKAYIKLTTLK